MGKAGDWGLSIGNGRGTIEFCKVMILGLLLSTSVWAVDGDMGIGTDPNTNGSEAYPWRIEDLADFDVFAGNSAYWAAGVHTKLITDINLSGRTYTAAIIAPDTSTSSGFQGTPFTGTFDGNGCTITDLTIIASGKDYIGLFGSISTNGQVVNLGLENVQIAGRARIGGLTGYDNSAAITHCYAAGTVSGTSGSVGGLVGYSYSGRISSCYATAAVSGTSSVGGLVGYSYSDSLGSCYASGSVSGTSSVGGLVGYSYSGMTTSSYATGLVSGTSSVGGLIGSRSYALIDKYCFWDTETSGQTTSAGGQGRTTAQMKTLSTFAGAGWSFIYGTATLGDWVMPEGSYPKLAWEMFSSVTIPSLKGLTEEQARVALNAAGLLCGETLSAYDLSVAVGLVSETYPRSGSAVNAGLTRVHILLAKETRYAGGDGVIEPYQIADVGNWVDLMNHPEDWNKSFVLTANINLDGQCFSEAPIAADTSLSLNFQGTQYTGIFDGNGHVVSNLTISATEKDYIGLFGYVGASGQVKNLGTENVNLWGARYVGGLVGYNDGTLTSCYAGGSVRGASTGGLAGANSGAIMSCYAASSVGIGEYAGGLVGYDISQQRNVISQCYARGPVQGTNDYGVGGLIGGGEALPGQTGVIEQSFWDTQTSGQSTSSGGTPKTTEQMQMQTTFTGWDFANTWAICEGTNYPRFQWQILPADMTCPNGVGFEDLEHYAGWWLGAACNVANNYCGGSDMDYSGAVDLGDFVMLAAEWMKQ